MFKLETETELLTAFRTRDRKLVELSKDVTLPLVVRHTVAWTHPAGGRAYILFAVPGGAPTGIVFDTNGSGPAVPHMCDWCHCSGMGSRVGLLTARLDSKRIVGVHVCSDLSCEQKLEDLANRSGGSATPSIEKLIERIGRFATEVLKIDLRASGR